MVRARIKSAPLFGLLLLFFYLPRIRPQDASPAPLDVSGQITVAGRSTPYLIRHLPVSSFPQLPRAIQDALTRRASTTMPWPTP